VNVHVNVYFLDFEENGKLRSDDVRNIDALLPVI
jgi:hypothetical protein